MNPLNIVMSATSCKDLKEYSDRLLLQFHKKESALARKVYNMGMKKLESIRKKHGKAYDGITDHLRSELKKLMRDKQKIIDEVYEAGKKNFEVYSDTLGDVKYAEDMQDESTKVIDTLTIRLAEFQNLIAIKSEEAKALDLKMINLLGESNSWQFH